MYSRKYAAYSIGVYDEVYIIVIGSRSARSRREWHERREGELPSASHKSDLTCCSRL